jgi:uncharacterized protein (UPF0335 family)
MASGNGVAAAQLRSFVERIERLEEEKKGISNDIRDVYAEAKGQGYDTKVMRRVIRMRTKDATEREEEAAILDIYLHALGMMPESAPAAESTISSNGPMHHAAE